MPFRQFFCNNFDKKILGMKVRILRIQTWDCSDKETINRNLQLQMYDKKLHTHLKETIL